jgi:hypothetical protein
VGLTAVVTVPQVGAGEELTAVVAVPQVGAQEEVGLLWSAICLMSEKEVMKSAEAGVGKV